MAHLKMKKSPWPTKWLRGREFESHHQVDNSSHSFVQNFVLFVKTRDE